jgi:DNA recombination protein RmuC
MDPILALIIGLVVGVVLGAVIGLLLARSRRTAADPQLDPTLLASRHETALAQVRAEETAARSRLSAELAAIQATAAALKEQVLAQQEQYQGLVERQRAEQRAETERQQRESKVLQALTPVQESLRTMQQKVTELESQRSRQHGELSQQLRTATESEERLRSTAESLASALRNNATRGVWGETQLRNVVQAAGLIERVDFDVQSSISSDAGAGRPDMVIHLPGGKNIAVDAKVPFTAYLEASQIAVTATGEEGARREQFIRQHVKAVRSHIDTLGGKAYWAGLEASPELVIAFIPSESLVASAMEADPGIMDYAFSKRVALASPVTLWSVLKTVAFSWQQDVVTQEAKTLFDLSRELYGRLATLASHVEKLGRSIESTVKHYNGFVGSLERQVLPSARKLSVLDESKVLGPQGGVEELPRDLTAYELVAELDLVAALESESTKD